MNIKQCTPRTATTPGFGLTAFGFVLLTLLCLAALPRSGQTSPAPGLTASLTSTGTILLTITNGLTNQYYTIYSKPALTDFIPWSGSITGGLGVTNFIIPRTPNDYFFKAVAGFDSDGDGILSWQDANDFDASAGILTITIETPANGSTFN